MVQPCFVYLVIERPVQQFFDFNGVQEKAMKHIQIFHGVQIRGNLMGWKIHGSLMGNF